MTQMSRCNIDSSQLRGDVNQNHIVLFQNIADCVNKICTIKLNVVKHSSNHSFFITIIKMHHHLSQGKKRYDFWVVYCLLIKIMEHQLIGQHCKLQISPQSTDDIHCVYICVYYVIFFRLNIRSPFHQSKVE